MPDKSVFHRLSKVRRCAGFLLAIVLIILLLQGSTVISAEGIANIRVFTRPVEFGFASWTVEALYTKWVQAALRTSAYLPDGRRSAIVLEYLDLNAQLRETEGQIDALFADPEIEDPEAASGEIEQRYQRINARSRQMAPLAEEILQNQLSEVLVGLGFTVGGQPIPPVLFHTTPPPLALIVSPRYAIRQDANVSIDPDLDLESIVALEELVAENLDSSTLVVGIGGVGTYPTMVTRASEINWLAEVIAHEWIHNYLILRPLGINYLSSETLRTINETVASIAGKEIGQELIARYYPNHLPPPIYPPAEIAPPGSEEETPEPPPFDFQIEMMITRETVDAMLAEGRVTEAEFYMEERRLVFWEEGYRIRKLNQAYFAFYGAYAATPGGAAGVDPVGAAVRALRAQSPSLAVFVSRIAWVTSIRQLEDLVGGRTNNPSYLFLSFNWPGGVNPGPPPGCTSGGPGISLSGRPLNPYNCLICPQPMP